MKDRPARLEIVNMPTDGQLPAHVIKALATLLIHLADKEMQLSSPPATAGPDADSTLAISGGRKDGN